MRRLATCRVCGKQEFALDFYKYSTRHYAHFDCYAKKFGLDKVSSRDLYFEWPMHLVKADKSAYERVTAYSNWVRSA
jgi:hypothetical protein